MTHECPDISDNWRGGRTATARILGINVKTLDRWTDTPVSLGGLRCTYARGTGRRVWSGREIKRFWHNH